MARPDLGPVGDVARLVERRPVGWDDLVLPERAFDQLRELCLAVPAGGVTALLHGAAGTGKTLAAHVCAEQLRLDLWDVDVRSLVGRHGGAAGRLLEPLFRAADRPSAIVSLSGAEALAGTPGVAEHVLRLAVTRRPPTIFETRHVEAVPASIAEGVTLTVALPCPDARQREELVRRAVSRTDPLATVDAASVAVIPATGGEIERAVADAAHRAALDTEELVSALRRVASARD